MATDQAFMEYVAGQMESAGEITYRKMFGEYGVYCNGKFFAVVCDNKLFIKPTEGGRAFIRDVVEAPAYEGARPSFLIEEQLDDQEWMGKLVQITIQELPEAKPRPKKRKRT